MKQAKKSKVSKPSGCQLNYCDLSIILNNCHGNEVTSPLQIPALNELVAMELIISAFKIPVTSVKSERPTIERDDNTGN